MNRLLAILLLVVSGCVSPRAEPALSTLKPVAQENADLPVLRSQQAEIAARYSESALIEPEFSEWREIPADSLRKAFPAWRFYVLTWSAKPTEKGRREGVSGALGLQITVAVNQADKTVKLFYGSGNYEEYGEFLESEKQTITSEDKARLLWDAFCEIHRQAWQDNAMEKVSDTEWKLGIFSYEDTLSVVNGVKTIVKRTQFIRVATDPATHLIVAWESVVETSDERTERAR